LSRARRGYNVGAPFDARFSPPLAGFRPADPVMLRIVFVALLLTCASSSADAATYAPDNPDVRRALERAAAFLAQANDPRLGAKALAGRVLVHLDRRDHAKVAEAVEAIRQELAGSGGPDESHIYSLGLAIAFLAELDAETYHDELRGLVDRLLSKQRPDGAWGYANRGTGDTSMTQYAVYGLWNAAQVGVQVDDDVWNRVVAWLLKTQDPSGAWGYQGNIGEPGRRVAQAEMRRSMTEAALASLYLSGEHFGFWTFRSERPSISPLLKPVEDAAAAKPQTAPQATFTLTHFQTALGDGNRWDAASKEPVYAAFPTYHLYTIERYHTFRDAALRKPAANDWYDLGAVFLLKAQQPDGSWNSQEGLVASTAFAALFLMRSTRATLVKLDLLATGTLVGGRGLPLAKPAPQAAGPSDAARPGTAPSKPGDALKDLARNLEDPKFLESLADLDRTAPLPDAPPPSELKQRLIELAGTNTPQLKAAVLTALGRTNDLDHVPLLIEALADPNPAVHQAAIDALRYLDRRSKELGKPLAPDPATRRAEAIQWHNWYRTIRPPRP
jgi:hypothetical protein